MCSWKAPWRARTPTVIGVGVVIVEGGGNRRCVVFFWGTEFTRVSDALKSGWLSALQCAE